MNAIMNEPEFTLENYSDEQGNSYQVLEHDEGYTLLRILNSHEQIISETYIDDNTYNALIQHLLPEGGRHHGD